MVFLTLLACLGQLAFLQLKVNFGYVVADTFYVLLSPSMSSNFVVTLLAVMGVIVAAVVARLIVVLPCFKATNTDPQRQSLINKVPSNIRKYNVMVLLGSGGHTGEMIRMLSQVDLSPVSRTWIVSSGDATSASKAQWYEETHCASSDNASEILQLHRARRVGESLMLSVKNTLVSFVNTGLLVYSRKPDALVVNGPGTSVPLAYVLFLFRFLGMGHTKIIYIESLARLQCLSVSGMLVLPIADRFLVQSEVLAAKYRRAEYYGILV